MSQKEAEDSASVHEDLVEWMCIHGFKPDTCHVKPADFQDAGRGLVCTKDISAGHLIIDVPRTLIITSSTVMNSYLCESIKRERLTPLAAICTFLVCERNRGSRSPWYHYIATLPQSYSLPAYWTTELTQTLPKAIKQTAVEQKQTVLDLFARCTKVFDEVRHLCADLGQVEMREEYLTWAWSTVNTRCVYWLQKDHPDLEKDGEDHYALVPLLDLLNHSHNVQVDAAYNTESRSYQIQTKLPYSAGHQVFINYGEHSNIRLLMEYGFILPNNPNDVINIPYDEFVSVLGDSSQSNSLKIIREQQLHRGHALSGEGVTWSLSTALKVAALEKHELSQWRDCMEDHFRSEQHKNATNSMLKKLLQLKMNQFMFQAMNPADPVEQMIDTLCKDHQQIITECLPAGSKLTTITNLGSVSGYS